MEQSTINNRTSGRTTRCLLIYPEFLIASFWNFRAACAIKGAKYPSPPLGLMTVAAMLPPDWELRLVDRNVENLHDDAIDWADLVLVGGMIAQQRDHLHVIRRVQARGKPVVTGGPDATNSPHIYASADHLVLGEAEVTLPRFLDDYIRGTAKPMYLSEDKADVTRSPIPRWELVDRSNYLNASLQWSRGCPFNCEFCDIIELFGRVPRMKTEEQVEAELDNLYALGHRGYVDIVDDNFIGNKKQAKKMLTLIAKWQQEHDWPFELGTEASLNLAKEAKLLALMQQAGFCAVFVGIESTEEEALRTTQKKQNLCDMVEAIHTIYQHGMFVWAGYIMGIDGESENVADGIISNIQNSAIPVSMVGLMFALPTTQLTRRLKREGRLPNNFDVVEGGDQCSAGLNFNTLRPKSEILRDYVRVIETVYAPAAYFGRVSHMAKTLDCSQRKLHLGIGATLHEAATFSRMICKVGFTQRWGYHWWKLLFTVFVNNPKAIRYALWSGALYLHFGEFSAWVAENTRQRIEIEAAAEADTRHAASDQLGRIAVA